MPLDDALARLIAAAQPALSTEWVSTFDADGRVLSRDVVSGLTVPPRDNSSMDGYAVRAADCREPGAMLQVAQRIPAGSVGTPLAQGTAARIFTGAQIPDGADAVVMQEDTAALPDAEGLGRVRIEIVPPAGQWIRRAGEDVAAGDVVCLIGSSGSGKSTLL
ncbi:MAG: molybdopterin molybdenumtransferase MoeA, partial [Gammaproteobacteria bacterium]|nr:molybdopterin molybdenumtransferase MoeA [Gammaproteobacteria bacterium]